MKKFDTLLYVVKGNGNCYTEVQRRLRLFKEAFQKKKVIKSSKNAVIRKETSDKPIYSFYSLVVLDNILRNLDEFGKDRDVVLLIGRVCAQ